MSRIDPADSAPGQSQAMAHGAPAAATRRALTIALADDIAEIQFLARTWLTGAGHRVLCSEDGRSLLQRVARERVDLIITDVMMPDGDGFEVIREVRAAHPSIRIVTMSGGAPVMPMAQCLHVAQQLGAHAVLAKPFNRARLFAAVDAAMAD